ncbi:MAG: thiazole synthase [Deltaproteobacteria bacterium]|nr:thiazole synthase [Deltaproteobacteria bacterium]
MKTLPSDPWHLAGRTLHSRLLVGTGKYANLEQTRAAIAESGAEIVTVAVRRVDFSQKQTVLDALDRNRHILLPNTAGCFTAEDAIRYANLGREAGLGDLVKLEVIGDPRTLFPDNQATLQAAKVLVADGFVVLPYIGDDPVLCSKLQDLGCAAVMPLGAPIGSGLGIRNPFNLQIILEQATVPVLVDAGVGTASDAAIALELGCTAVLMNTAIAGAKDPVRMARAMRLAVQAGREAFLAGRIARKLHAAASSPLTGLLA